MAGQGRGLEQELSDSDDDRQPLLQVKLQFLKTMGRNSDVFELGEALGFLGQSSKVELNRADNSGATP